MTKPIRKKVRTVSPRVYETLNRLLDRVDSLETRVDKIAGKRPRRERFEDDEEAPRHKRGRDVEEEEDEEEEDEEEEEEEGRGGIRFTR